MKFSLIAISCLFAIAGCRQPAANSQALSEPVAGFPVLLTDDLGREITIPRAPTRIISLAPAITETLYAIGAGDRVLAVTINDTYPAQAKSLPKVGGFMPSTINIEIILALKPDLVFVAGKFHEPIVAALSPLGIDVVAVDSTSFDTFYSVTDRVGQAVGHRAEAHRIIDDVKNRRGAVLKRTELIPLSNRPKVLYVLADNPLMTTSGKTFIGEMIADAGGINLFADTKQDYPQISDEAVIARNPDLILAPDHGAEGMPGRLPGRPGWNLLSAIRAKRIVTIDEDLINRHGPRLIEGLEAMEKIFAAKR